ncbi:hypothetical protein [Pararcticibacter amylolyticus]|uniref:Lipoprotein n=1 Tax=Pararcticibacter amylolyticus TaxID=2173175 RepID=A0A2U2P9B5_9SPHI|nr:hypothetical protein [Pararcticibacter amylolyticus]PWG77986.1 hypothetical protein DDR33_24625 [Pararcticibacter amylolyticus]
MKKVLFFIVAATLIASCKSDEAKYEKELTANIKELTNIKNNIDHQIRVKDIDRSRYSLNFTSDSTDLHSGYFIYDEEVAKSMKELNIKSIRYDKTPCTLKKDYDTMYFQLDDVGVSKGRVVYFVFDSCGVAENVKNKKTYRKRVSENWSLYIDSNYPSSYIFR